MAAPNWQKYERIAAFYDLLDGPFEICRYRPLRPLLFAGLSGRILEAGVGTGRNFPFYSPGAQIVAIDFSPAMLKRAERRRPLAAAPVELRRMDATRLDFPDRSFDAAVATFLFCVLPDPLQVPALRELRRVLKPGGEIRLLEYVRPKKPFRRFLTRLWEPWVSFAYGASFDRRTEGFIVEAGLELVEARFLVADLLKFLRVRVPALQPANGRA